MSSTFFWNVLTFSFLLFLVWTIFFEIFLAGIPVFVYFFLDEFFLSVFSFWASLLKLKSGIKKNYSLVKVNTTASVLSIVQLEFSKLIFKEAGSILNIEETKLTTLICSNVKYAST